MTSSPADIAEAARVLARGGLVAFPTETVYGLGADAENPRAVERLFAVKKRPARHPLIVHLGQATELSAWAHEVSKIAIRLAECFWPGPLTLVLRRASRIGDAVTGGLETVALRVPQHPLALALLRTFGGGIAAPSANRFGAVSPTTAEHVRTDLGSSIEWVLDGGPCRLGIESTIVDVSGFEPRILRPGALPVEEIEEALQRSLSRSPCGNVAAPGQHPSHYAPAAQVLLAEPQEIEARAEKLTAQGLRVGVLGFSSDPVVPELPQLAHVLWFGSGEESARRLYAALREFDQKGCDVVLASLPEERGLGLALADRLRRAAGPRARRV